MNENAKKFKEKLENLKISGRERDNMYNRAVDDVMKIAQETGVIEKEHPVDRRNAVYNTKTELDDMFNEYRAQKETEIKKTVIK